MCRLFNRLSILLLCSICLPVCATTIHKWIDANGLTHFSDASPAGNTIEVDTLEFEDNFPPTAELEADYYSIVNQWKRMRKEREAKTKLQIEQAQIRMQESTARNRVIDEYPAYGGYPRYALPYERHYGGVHHHDHRSAARRGRHHVKAHGRHVAAEVNHPTRAMRHHRTGYYGGYYRPSHGGAGLSFRINLH